MAGDIHIQAHIMEKDTSAKIKLAPAVTLNPAGFKTVMAVDFLLSTRALPRA
jgi:hypothetical protein